MELARYLGIVSASIFNVYHKFFDTVDSPTLLDEAIRVEVPPKEMALAIQQHLAPHVIQANSLSSKPVEVFKSVLAGCIFLLGLVESISKAICEPFV